MRVGKVEVCPTPTQNRSSKKLPQLQLSISIYVEYIIIMCSVRIWVAGFEFLGWFVVCSKHKVIAQFWQVVLRPSYNKRPRYLDKCGPIYLSLSYVYWADQKSFTLQWTIASNIAHQSKMIVFNLNTNTHFVFLYSSGAQILVDNWDANRHRMLTGIVGSL